MYQHFDYKSKTLHCDGVSLETLATEVGTPFYAYSLSSILERASAYVNGLKPIGGKVCYSVKANSNLTILKELFAIGCGADIVSGGELYRVLLAGGDDVPIIFSGVGKTKEEIDAAIDARVTCFNIESVDELDLIASRASLRNAVAPIAIRVNPNIDAKTHPYISTGLYDNKFGVPAKETLQLYKRAKDIPSIKVSGLACHIGSQLTTAQPFAESWNFLLETVRQLGEMAISIDHLDIGGGLGINYGDGKPCQLSIAEFCDNVCNATKSLANQDITVMCEPGRSIVGEAGTLVTKVIRTKLNGSKHFTVVDGAMNDLIRPSLYQSHHPILPVREKDNEQIPTDVVGPICESGDFFAKDRKLAKAEAGDLLALMAAGAYGASMASRYNSRPIVAEVLCKDSVWKQIRKRESYRDLVALESF